MGNTVPEPEIRRVPEGGPAGGGGVEPQAEASAHAATRPRRTRGSRGLRGLAGIGAVKSTPGRSVVHVSRALRRCTRGGPGLSSSATMADVNEKSGAVKRREWRQTRDLHAGRRLSLAVEALGEALVGEGGLPRELRPQALALAEGRSHVPADGDAVDHLRRLREGALADGGPMALEARLGHALAGWLDRNAPAGVTDPITLAVDARKVLMEPWESYAGAYGGGGTAPGSPRLPPRCTGRRRGSRWARRCDRWCALGSEGDLGRYVATWQRSAAGWADALLGTSVGSLHRRPRAPARALFGRRGHGAARRRWRGLRGAREESSAGRGRRSRRLLKVKAAVHSPARPKDDRATAMVHRGADRASRPGARGRTREAPDGTRDRCAGGRTWGERRTGARSPRRGIVERRC